MTHWLRKRAHVRRVLRGAHLPCGCLVGVYETYAGQTVVIIDDPHPPCHLPDHRDGHLVTPDTREAEALTC